MSQRSMELKVGALILASLGLLVVFVVVMGGLSLQPTYRIFVDFENPGGLQSGAPVRISGVRVGRVTSIEFRGGKVNEKTGEPAAPIRVVASIEQKYKDAIYEDARFFVTSQGVLGEMYLAIDPGTYGKPPLQDEAVVPGVSPPRLDLLLSESYELLHKAYVGIIENEEQIGEMFDGAHKTLKGTGRFFEENQDKLNDIVSRVQSIGEETEKTIVLAREQYVEGPRIQRIFSNVERTTKTLNENLGPLMGDAREVLQNTERITKALGDDQQLTAYRQITEDAQAAMKSVRATAGSAEAISSHVEAGKGTIGAIVMDEALYDDLQEMLRDLKHNPWKFFWKQ